MSGILAIQKASGGVLNVTSTDGATSTDLVLPLSGTVLSNDNGVVNISGVGARITGDFSNATPGNRVALQSNTTNGFTVVEVIPNGTSTYSAVDLINSSDTVNHSGVYIAADSTAVKLTSFARGTGTLLPMTFITGGAERMRIDTAGNVGIGTSSPAGKAAKTFTIQNGGSSSVGLTIGDYSSNISSMITINEALGARGDGNSTFGGRYGAAFRRCSGATIASGTTLGYYAFGGQWGTDIGYVGSKLLYAASITGVAEGNFTSATAMPTAISFKTGSIGEDLINVNTTYGTERMRIDSIGNVLLTSGTGGLGYGTGAGGTVTQLTSKSTAVSLNKPTGRINMSNSALAAGASVTFTLNNTFISDNDIVNINVAAAYPSYEVMSTNGNNGCYITVKNKTAGSLSEAVLINFSIIKGATA